MDNLPERPADLDVDAVEMDCTGLSHSESSTPATTSSPPRTDSDDVGEGSLWTVVDVVVPRDGEEDDDDGSVVEISRASSPLAVQFRDLKVTERPFAKVSWPLSLPWFKFQDRYLNNVILQDVLSQHLGQLGGNNKNSPITSSKHLQQLSTPDGFCRVASELGKFIPEREEGENVTRVKALVGNDPLMSKNQELQLFVYQLSNDLIEDEDDKYIDDQGKYTKAIEIYRGLGLPRAVWREHFSRTQAQPTGRAFMDNLYVAALNTRDLDVCELLLEFGADPDKAIDSWVTGQAIRPVQLAMDARVRDLDFLKLFLRFGADIDAVTDEDEEGALHKAASDFTLEAVKLIVEAGADIRDGEHHPFVAHTTALTSAAEADSRLSFQSEEEKDERDAEEGGRRGLESLQYLLPLYAENADHDIIQGALIVAAASHRKDMIPLLIDAGADVNEPSSRGYTPLIAAVQRSYRGNGAGTATMLLKLGADPNLAFSGRGRASDIRPIHIAAARGDDSLVRVLLDHGADPNAPASPKTVAHVSMLQASCGRMTKQQVLQELAHCRTPLQLALYNNSRADEWSDPSKKSPESARRLLRAGCLLAGGEFARAPAFNCRDLLGELVARSPDVNELDWAGRNALDVCLEFEAMDLVGHLLQLGVRLRGGELLAAVRTGNQEVVDQLLTHGAAAPVDKGQLLEAAALSKNWHLMTWLMENHDIPYSRRALCAAISSGLGETRDNEPHLIALLGKREPTAAGSLLESTAIGCAAFMGQLWVLDHLLKLKAGSVCKFPLNNIEGYYSLAKGWNRQAYSGYKRPFWRDSTSILCSVLVPAIAGHQYSAIWRLLRAGFAPDALTLLAAVGLTRTYDLPDDWSPEQIDRRARRSLDLVVRLTERMSRVQINARARYNLDTPLQAAARARRVDVVRHLLAAGADVNAPPAEPLDPRSEIFEPLLPRTALQAAVEYAGTDMMDVLIEAGADVNAAPGSKSGATALQITAGAGHIGIARTLIDLGADVKAPGARRKGRTALEIAAERGRVDMVQFLLESGAATGGGARRSYYWALQFAERMGHSAVETLLLAWGEPEGAGDSSLSSEDYEDYDSSDEDCNSSDEDYNSSDEDSEEEDDEAEEQEE